MGKRGPWVLVGVMAAVVAVLVVVLLLTRGGDDSPESLLAGVPDAVAEAGTAHLAMTVDVDSDSFDANTNGEGVVEFATGAGTFGMNVAGTHLEMRTDGTTLYVLPDGEATWLATKADDGDPLGSFGTGPGLAVTFVDLLGGDPGKIDDRGTDDIGDVEARHLRTTYAAADAPEQLEQIAPADGKLRVDVWLDGDGRPVRERVRGQVQGIDLVLTVDLTDWGTDLDAAIPPEGEIRDVSPQELLQLFAQPAG